MGGETGSTLLSRRSFTHTDGFLNLKFKVIDLYSHSKVELKQRSDKRCSLDSFLISLRVSLYIL